MSNANAYPAASVRTGANLPIAGVMVGLNVVLLFVLPAYLLPLSLHWAWLLVPITLATLPFWALIHEGIHGDLHPDRRISDALSRGLCILFGTPFEVVRFGHLSHHSLNGNAAERPEFYDPDVTSAWRVGLVYYARLLFGVYAAEVLSGPFSLLPRRRLRPLVRRAFYEGEADARNMADRAERQLLAPDRLRRTRLDAGAILVVFGTSLALYGELWPLLALALLGRGFLVSFMDNAAHYGAELDDAGQGYDLHLPRPMARLVLNANYHGTHHRHPNTPWPALPEVFERDGVGYAGSYLVVPWRQLRGPLRMAGTTPEPGVSRRGAPA